MMKRGREGGERLGTRGEDKEERRRGKHGGDEGNRKLFILPVGSLGGRHCGSEAKTVFQSF